jgi:hypothetical protein
MTNQTGYPSNYSKNQSADKHHSVRFQIAAAVKIMSSFGDMTPYISVVFRKKKTAASIFRVEKE